MTQPVVPGQAVRPALGEPSVRGGCLWLTAALALAVAGWTLSVPEPPLAVALGLLFTACGLKSPPHAVVVLLLLTPFFVGEAFQPYFWLPEVLVYATLAGAVVRFARAGALPCFPWAPWFLLFLASTVVSIPLNLRELVWEVRDGTLGTLVGDVWGGAYWANAFYLRMVLDVASGVGLYVVAANLEWGRRTVLALGLALTAVLTALLALELLIFWRVVPGGDRFLSVSLLGHARTGQTTVFSGQAPNQGYLAHLLVTLLPLMVCVTVDHVRRTPRLIAGAGAAVTLVSAVLTVQRGVFPLLGAQLVLFLLLALALSRGGRSTTRHLGVAGVALGVVLAALALAPQREEVVRSFHYLWQSGDPFRQHAMSVSWRMLLDHPWLGVGAGRFIRFFGDYSTVAASEYLWSHSLYAQLLAEQGVLGLLAFVAMVAVVMTEVVRRRHALQDGWTPVAFLAVSLLSWLAYGFLHYTFLQRSLQLYFWAGLGILASRGAAGGRRARWPRWAWTLALVGLAVAAGLRLTEAIRRPAVEAGLHTSETLDGVPFRWTRERARLGLDVRGPVLSLTLASPGTKAGPQAVSLMVDGVLIRQLQPPPGVWVTVDLPIPKPPGSRVQVGIHAAPTIVPRALGLNDDPRRLGVMLQPVRWADRPR